MERRLQLILSLCLLVAERSVSTSGADNYENQPITRSRRDVSDPSYFYYQESEYPRDCEEVHEQCEENTDSGIYTIQPEGSPEPFKVYCNNTIDGGNWTVFQRRVDGSVDFYRNWEQFKEGFGFLNKEFWLGNDNLAYLTSQKDYELRIDMNNNNGDPYFAKYSLFRISDEESKYRMVALGDYLPESTANYDCLTHHRNMSFSTHDRDNDRHTSTHCVTHVNYKSAWWWNACHYYCNLNGLFFGCSGCYQSLQWYSLPGGRYDMEYVEMKIRTRR